MFHKHHKVFRSQGGGDELENIELLTPLEHAELHAEVFLSGGPWFDNRHEGWKLFSKELREKVLAEQSKRRTELNFGRSLSEETKQKISTSRKGQKVPEETKQKISSSMTGEQNHMYRKKVSQETREKQSLSAKRRCNKETNKAFVERVKQKNSEKVTCPHCNKTGGAGGMKRHHFDNCKHKNG